jgi:hypothetical protein
LRRKYSYLFQESKYGHPVYSWSPYRMSYLSSWRIIKSIQKWNPTSHRPLGACELEMMTDYDETKNNVSYSGFVHYHIF